MNLKTWLQQVSVPVYLLIMLFAMSSWIDLTGLYAEIPILVNELPEGWNLPSYLLIMIETANISPLIYTLLLKKWPHKIKEWPVIYGIIIIGTISCLLLGFFWDYTTVINGAEYSTGLFALTFTLALVDTTSTVVYLPYMHVFRPQYLTAYYTGEGLSGIAGILGIIQGASGEQHCINTSTIIQNATTGINETVWDIEIHYDEPRFSVELYFCFLFGIMLTSGVAFTCIHFMPFVKRQYIYSSTEKTESNLNVDYTAVSVKTSNVVEKSTKDIEPVVYFSSLSKYQYVYLLCINCFMGCLQYSIIPGTQPYTTLPYGDYVYSLSVRLSTIATMLSQFFTLFVPSKSIMKVTMLAVIGVICSMYCVTMAALSPTPPLQDSIFGVIIVLTASLIPPIVFCISRVYIALILKDYGGRMALVWCGGVTQIGTLTGSIVCFLALNVFHLFERMPSCTNM